MLKETQFREGPRVSSNHVGSVLLDTLSLFISLGLTSSNKLSSSATIKIVETSEMLNAYFSPLKDKSDDNLI